MNSTVIAPESAAKPAKAKKQPRNSAKQSRKAAGTNKSSKPAAEPPNKKAAVIAMMKRPKGATLAEIAEATGWQKHTIRGFISILRRKGLGQIESVKNASVERAYKLNFK